MNSERNRPHNLARKKQYDTNEEALQVFNLLLKQGKEPSEIADIVFEGIKDNIFYILQVIGSNVMDRYIEFQKLSKIV